MAEQFTADPTSISTLVTSQDADRIAATIAAKYGFTPPVAYCYDLAAFVLATEAHIAALERRLSLTVEDEETLMRYDSVSAPTGAGAPRALHA